MKKIVFIAKTNLNTDGRILNELKILKQEFLDTIKVDFILMPDKKLEIDVKEVDKFHIINTFVRNSKLLRPLTVFHFTLKSLYSLSAIKPDIIHAEDTAVTLPVFLYKKFINKSVVLIYDDHELPNEDEGFFLKIFQKVENYVIKLSNTLITANEERLNYLKEHNSDLLGKDSHYFLNLPYFEDSVDVVACSSDKVEVLANMKKTEGIKVFMHQGIIEVERGRSELATFSKLLPDDNKIMIVGVTRAYFDEFIDEYGLNEDVFIFIGIVPYYELNQYWRLADASIVMYLPTFLNNRLCAPNRLYISFLNCIPIVVNKSNPVLKNFVDKMACGFYIEDLSTSNIGTLWNVSYSNDAMDNLKESEVRKFINLYKQYLIE